MISLHAVQEAPQQDSDNIEKKTTAKENPKTLPRKNEKENKNNFRK